MARVRDMVANVSGTNVTITTTTEKDVINSGPVPMTRQTQRFVIVAWAQVTVGVDGTHFTPQIRRGSGITGTALIDAVAEEIKTAVGDNEPFFAMAVDDRADEGSVDYSFTLKATAATDDSTVLQSGILVFAL